MNLKNADRIVEASAVARSKLLVGPYLRLHLGVALLKKCLDDGVVGRPLLAKADYGRYLPHWQPDADYRKTYSPTVSKGGGIILESGHV